MAFYMNPFKENNPNVTFKEFKQGKSMKNKIPTNLKEAINELNKIISKEDKEYILEHGALSVHHSLGRWIRNNWGLWENDSILKFNMVKLGFIHPDDISNYIIEEFIKYEKHK